MCVAFLPVAIVLLWQDTQVPLTCVWSTVMTGFQAVLLWQASHKLLVEIWDGFLPVAFVPLWQVKQAAVVVL
jgi:hypothetical protein